MEQDIEQIEKLLRGVEKPSFDLSRKELIKSHLMRQVEGRVHLNVPRRLHRVASQVVDAAQSVKLPVSARVILKERIMDVVSGTGVKGWVWRFSGVPKRLLSGVVVASMMFGFISFMAVDLNVALADSFTAIEEIDGGVVVVRDGEKMDAYAEMELFEGDRVVTEDDGFASIVFLDDSIVRLSTDTGLNILRLFADSDNKASTYVEIEVYQGNAWSRVLNLLDKDSAFVVKAGEFMAKAQKAAFNVSVDDVETRVEVYHHVVEVQPVLSVEVADTKVATGQQVTTSVAGKPKVVEIAPEVHGDTWVADNLKSDKEHVINVNEKRKVAREEVAEDNLHSFKSIKTGVQKFLTFDDIEEAKLSFEAVQMDFVKGEVMLENGEITETEAGVVFESFVEYVEGFKDMIANVRENGDFEYADELKDYLSSELSQYKKDLSSILPDSPLYPAKLVMMEAEVVAAESESEIAVVKTEQVTVKLEEVSDLAEAGEGVLAVQAFDEYVEVVESNKKEVEALSESAGEEAMELISEAEKDETDVLNSIKEVSDKAGLSEVSYVVNKQLGPGANPGLNVVNVVGGEGSAGVAEQRVSEFGVTVVGEGQDEKPLDPLLNLGR
ncbi:hypothetical protein HOE67_02040 [Candidatus Peregrinibacteria bacterium]|jgi:hypothetical protein|nr:hypothetical protein [Candidatus Peregrinibacteria bacterium]MBT4055869.1 hypothetical protein [Candidatus Peregrinibacteria bacterium]